MCERVGGRHVLMRDPVVDVEDLLSLWSGCKFGSFCEGHNAVGVKRAVFVEVFACVCGSVRSELEGCCGATARRELVRGGRAKISAGGPVGLGVVLGGGMAPVSVWGD